MPEPSATLVSAVPVPFTADGDLDDAGLQPLYRSLDAAGGLHRGGTGGVSGVSSVFPRPFVALADALRHGDEQAAAAAQDRVKRAVEAVAGADIALIKAGLALRGLPAGPPRVALDPPSPAQLDTLRHAIEELT